MKYIVLGNVVNKPTEAQMLRADKNGGWEEKQIDGEIYMWNICVSPSFTGAPYNLKGI